jgi:hypothetical protein
VLEQVQTWMIECADDLTIVVIRYVPGRAA